MIISSGLASIVFFSFFFLKYVNQITLHPSFDTEEHKLSVNIYQFTYPKKCPTVLKHMSNKRKVFLAVSSYLHAPIAFILIVNSNFLFFPSNLPTAQSTYEAFIGILLLINESQC